MPRNPKPKTLTPIQEAELEKIDRQLARARIYQYGVQKILEDGEYCNSMTICAQILTEAEDIRRAAFNEILKDSPMGFRRNRRGR